MIKQFNFYDLYGYLLPGLALLGFVWVPLGVISTKWPDQDISKAIFLTVLAYVIGHVVQTIATKALPSKVMLDDDGRRRFPSDRLLDKGCSELSSELKLRLGKQVRGRFSLDLHLDDDGDGAGSVFSDRNTAFFLARSYLIAKKTAHYVEQFEGLYAMMRGLATTLAAGACYFAGWGLAFHRNFSWLRTAMSVVGTIAAVASLAFAVTAATAIRRNNAVVNRILGFALLMVATSIGFWLGVWQSPSFWSSSSETAEWVLWLACLLSLIAAARCFSSYQTFAIEFAKSAWRDFMVYMTIEEESATGHDAADDEAS